MVYFATPKAAIRFSSFEFASGKLRGGDGKPMFGKMTSFIAGLCAGTMEAFCVTTPQVLWPACLRRLLSSHRHDRLAASQKLRVCMLAP